MHQELNLVPKFSVLQNMAMGFDIPTNYGLVNWKAARRRADEVLGLLEAKLNLDTTVERLNVSQRWMVALGRSLMREGARMVALDEPTASFGNEDSHRVFDIVRNMAGRGVAVLYISHRLEEVLDLSARITVFRNGQIAGVYQRGELDHRALTAAIAGKEIIQPARHVAKTDATQEPVLDIAHVVAWPRVVDVSLEVRAGEIVGLAGLVGAGRTELARVIAGADTPCGGRMSLDGKRYAPHSTHDAIAAGVVLVPEERRAQGLILEEIDRVQRQPGDHDVQRVAPVATPCSARPRRATRPARSSAPSRSSARRPLSASRRSAAAISRRSWSAVSSKRKPKVVILDEPTVGVDVGARSEIYDLIRQRADDGAAVLMISSDFEELHLCDRVVVMREGRRCRVRFGRGRHERALDHPLLQK